MTWYYEINDVRHDNMTEDDITGLRHSTSVGVTSECHTPTAPDASGAL